MIVLLGGGGHSKVIAEALEPRGEQFQIKDDSFEGTEPIACPRCESSDALAPDCDDHRYYKAGRRITDWLGEEEHLRSASVTFMMAIGSVGDCTPRKEMFERAIAAGRTPSHAVRAPSAYVSTSAEAFGKGTFIAPGAMICANVKLGQNVIVNTRAVVEHDCIVGGHSHIASGAILCGAVTIGEAVHVGAGAVIKQGVTIGDGATVGMGAVILEDVPAGHTWVGNPAQGGCDCHIGLGEQCPHGNIGGF